MTDEGPATPQRPVGVIAGAARGIGAATAVELAGAGWDLVLGDVAGPDTVAGLSYDLATRDQLTGIAQRCRALGVKVSELTCDVRDEGSLRELVELAGPRLTAVVAVAGILGCDGPAWEQSAADLDRDLSVNLHGIANLARVAVPRLLASPDPRRCRFVAVISSAAERGLPRLASYVASKHAALGYVRTLAADLASTGITVNAVLPGSTRTELLTRTAAAYDLSTAEGFAANQRIGRLIEPAEIAAAIGWLCSAGASAITGSVVSVDGAFTG